MRLSLSKSMTISGGGASVPPNLVTFSELISATVAADQGFYVNNISGTRAGSSGVVNDDSVTPAIPFYWRTTATAYALFGVTATSVLVSGETYTIRARLRSFGADITSISLAGVSSSTTSTAGFPVTSAEGWKDITVTFVSNGSRFILAPQGNTTDWGYVRLQIQRGSQARGYRKTP
jgi:hypothetical protein